MKLTLRRIARKLLINLASLRAEEIELSHLHVAQAELLRHELQSIQDSLELRVVS